MLLYLVEKDSTYRKGYIRLASPRVNINGADGGSASFRVVHAADMPIHKMVSEPVPALGLIGSIPTNRIIKESASVEFD